MQHLSRLEAKSGHKCLNQMELQQIAMIGFQVRFSKDYGRHIRMYGR